MKKQWPIVPLGEVLSPTVRKEVVDAEREYRLLGVRLDGRGPFLREKVTGTQTSATKLFRVAKDDFIYSRLFACRGAFGVITKELNGCYVSGEFPTFVAAPTRIDVDFLRYWFRLPAVIERVNEDCSGSTPLTRNRFKEHFFLALGIPLPPLAEQRGIVAQIEELTAQIQEARTLHRQAAEEAEAILASRISQLFGKGVQHGWRTGVLADYVADDCYGTSEKTSDDSSGTPILRMGNIQDGCLDFRDLKYLHLSKKERAKLLLKRGDILVNRTNSAELVGKCAVFEGEGEYSFASYLIRLRLDMQQAEPGLVAAYINSPLGRAYMLSEKKQMTGQANVNSTKLKALPIALPSLPEQRRIVTELNALQAEVDALNHLQTETAAELDALLPAILDRAFKGQLQ